MTIALIWALTGLGVAVLPWTDSELEDTRGALNYLRELFGLDR